MTTASHEKIGKVSSKSVLKHTGKNWSQWIDILNKAGAKNWTHKEIVEFLRTRYKISIWWQQSVTNGYETSLGKKVEGRNAKGEYSMVVSRTFPGDVKQVWKFLDSPQGMAIWLKPYSEFCLRPKNVYENETGAFGEIRTMKINRRIRMTWQETEWPKPSILQVHLVPRPKKKSILIFNHDGLSNGRQRLQMKEYWTQIVDELLSTFSTLQNPVNGAG